MIKANQTMRAIPVVTGVLLLQMIGSVVTASAQAQESGPRMIEEVIVTATKRGDINVQDIAGTVNALSGDTLQNRGITDFEGFAGQIPGLQFQDLGPGDKEYIIRGINGNGPAVVGAYFDEYVITANDQQDGGGKNAPIKMIDMQRVEVLNGPQGTLYGANSMAGNIKFIPRKPDAGAFDAFVDTDFSYTREGSFNYTVSGAVNLPLAQDTLALRLVGWRTDADGWIDQPRLENGPGRYTGYGKNINDEETNGGRAMLRWTPDERFTLDLLYLNQELKTGGSPRFTKKGSPAWPNLPPALLAAVIAAPDAGPPVPLPGLPPLTPTEDFINVDITHNPRDDKVELFGGTAAYDSDFGTATLSASHYKHEIDFRFDSTPILLFFGVGAPAATVQPQTYETDMVEARFASELDGPFNFVTGVYYQKDNNDFEVHVPSTDGSGNAAPWDPSNANDFFGGGTTFFGRARKDEIEQKAIFGEATLDFLDRWELLVGVRAFKTNQSSIQQTLHNFGGASGPVAGTQIGTNANGNAIGLIKTNDDTVRPKVSLSFDATDQMMLYALYSEGFRVGGINNANQPFAPGIPATFKSDELTNWEFGMKSRWLDNSLQFNATLFLIDWKDIQVEPRDPVGNIPFTTNGGSAQVNGVEWAFQWLTSENLELDFTGTYYIDRELTEDQPILPGASSFIIAGLDGDKMPNVPEVQLYGAVKYNTEVMGGRTLNLIGDVTYRGKTNTEFRTDSLFNLPLDSYTLVNLYANLDINDSFSVGVYVKNVGDELAIQDGIATFQDPASVVAARPRTVGATLSWRY